MRGFFTSAIFIVLSGLAIFFASFTEKGTITHYPFSVSDRFPPMPTNKSNAVTVEGAALGRYLFYDPILSSDSSLSCSSCHKQEFAFSDAPNAFSRGIKKEAMARNTPALFNLAWHPSLFWDGRATSIEEQVFHPVRTASEMNLPWTEASKRINASKFYKSKFSRAFEGQKIDSTTIAKAIGQFLRTLISCRSKYDMVTKGEADYTHDEYEGFVLVNDQTKGDCLHCHTTDANGLGSTFSFSNNGLDMITDAEKYKDKGLGLVTGKIYDNGKFKIPSLRNVAFTAPYMHDGRFKTLEEVIDFYSDSVHACANVDYKMEFARNGGAHLSRDEKRKIIAFLYTLSDSVFIRDPAFSNPFVKK